MADDLKRVGLIFSADGVKDFKKTMQEVNLEINKNYNEFKLAQSQWDESTTKVQKLREQHEYLTNAIEIQQDKVNLLSMQLADMENAETKNTQAIKKKRTELLNAEIQLKNYNNRLKNTNTDLNNAEKGIKTTAEKLTELTEKVRENETAFKLTQSQYTAMTSKSQKLKDEQNYLTNAYELQKGKVELLNEQLNELEKAEDKDTIAISKKKQELQKAETELNNYNTKLKIVSNQLENASAKAIEFGTKVENTGKKIESAGKKMSAFSAATGTALVASAKSAIDFEDAFTGVEKTVDGTTEQMEELKQGIRDMAKEIPSTTTEISAVAEAAGQLGIKTEDILSFTKVMIDLGNSTNLSAEEAASSLAKFANITKISAKDYDKLGSTIVALGNNFATTESDIVEMSTRLAATGELAGLSEPQILAMATAMSSVGIEAEAGGSAMSKLLKQIQVACETGSDDLKDFAKVAGMSVDDFKKAFEKDAVSALTAFISGLNDTERNGKSAITILEDMGLSEVRLSNTILSLANASDVMNKAVQLGNEAWEDNTALTNEANKRYDTLKSKLTMAMNKIKDMAITLGNKLMPSIEKVLDKLGKWIDKFEDLSDEQVDMIVNIGLIVTAIAPLLTIIGKLTTTLGTVTKGIGTFVQAIGVASGTITSTSTAVNGLAKVFTAVTSPVGLACTAIGVAVAGIAIAVNKSNEDVKEAFSGMGEAATDFYNGLQTAEGYLDSFNSTMFATNEEQQELQTQMDEIQAGITQICKTASDERRGYTQEEITQLDEYFEKLRELKNREIEIQNQIAGAITQQAVTNAETFQGSLEEYKAQSQEWIATAQQQADKTIEIIEQSSIEEVALLNQRYGDQANMQNEAYATEYNKLMEQKQAKIDAANSEVAEVLSVYSKGYADRANQDGDFYEHLKHYIGVQEDLEKAHNEQLRKIKDDELWYVTNTNQAIVSENETFAFHQKDTWNQMYKYMSDSEAEQLGVWLALLAQTELYGGEISEENRKMVEAIMESYDEMPEKTRKAMQNAMSPMLEEMKNAEPTLWAKASNIANGVLNRLKKSFDIHSPSRKTREIFKNVMKRNGEGN